MKIPYLSRITDSLFWIVWAIDSSSSVIVSTWAVIFSGAWGVDWRERRASACPPIVDVRNLPYLYRPTSFSLTSGNSRNRSSAKLAFPVCTALSKVTQSFSIVCWCRFFKLSKTNIPTFSRIYEKIIIRLINRKMWKHNEYTFFKLLNKDNTSLIHI